MKNTKKKILLGIGILFVSLIILNINVYASSLKVSKSSVTINKGKSTTVTVTGSDVTGDINVSSSNSAVASVSGGGWIENNSISIKITGKKAGTATISVSGSHLSNGNAKDVGTLSKTIKVTVKDSSSSNTTSTSDDEDSSNKKKSSDATLSNLGVTPKEYDFKGFKKSVTGSNAEYKVKVPNSITKLTVYATPSSSKAKYSVSGNTGFKVGTNIISVKVTAEDGTTKTYKIYVTRASGDEEEVIPNVIDDENSTDDNTSDEPTGIGLDSLEVQGYVLTPEFKSNTYEYTVEIGEQKFESLDELKNLIKTSVSYGEAMAVVSVQEGTEDDYFVYNANIKVSDYEREYASYDIKFVKSLADLEGNVEEEVDTEEIPQENMESAEKDNNNKDLIFGLDRDFVEKLALAGCSLILFLIVIVQGIVLHKKTLELDEYDLDSYDDDSDEESSDEKDRKIDEDEKREDDKEENRENMSDEIDRSKYEPRYRNPRSSGSRRGGRHF